MSNKKIKVVGFSKKEIFDDNIEYRNFNPNLCFNNYPYIYIKMMYGKYKSEYIY